MRRSHARMLALAAALAACGDGKKAPPKTPAPATKPAAPVATSGVVPATGPLAESAPPRLPPPVESEFLRSLLSGPEHSAEWVDAAPFVVVQEHPVIDVRDTRRAFDQKTLSFFEKPVDGTVNPAKTRTNDGRAERAASLAARHARLAAMQLDRFKFVVGDPLGLPALDAKPIPLVALWSDAAWDAWTASVATSPPGDDVVWRFGPEQIAGEDELKCDRRCVQKSADVALAREVTRVLLRRAAAALQGDEAKGRANEGPLWLFDGVEDVLGTVECSDYSIETLEGTLWRHETILLARVQEARAARTHADKWTLAELMKVVDDARPSDRGDMRDLFRGRAWAFCHFLWHYDGAKYRQKLLAFLGEALRGPKTSDDFAREMGRPDASDWGPVEIEFEWYWNQLLARKVGTTVVTRQAMTPSTDPPTGRVEDDPDFVESWKESRARK